MRVVSVGDVTGREGGQACYQGLARHSRIMMATELELLTCTYICVMCVYLAPTIVLDKEREL